MDWPIREFAADRFARGEKGERKMSAIAWSAIMMMMEIQRLERKIKDMSK